MATPPTPATPEGLAAPARPGAPAPGAASPPAAPAGPRRGRSVLLALSWYDPRVHRGVARFAAERGWRLDARMANTREPVWGWRGDGVLCKLGCTQVDRQVAELIASLGLPTVDLSMFGPEHGVPGFEFDPRRIGELAAEHLAACGVAHYGFFPLLDEPPVRMRRAGFEAALAERGHALLDVRPVAAGEDWLAAEERLGAQLAALPRPIGILCFNDTWGAQLIHALERAGLRCPEDVAVLGVDNQALTCETLPVPLSSVALDLEAWGAGAAAQLEAAMNADAARAPGMQWFPAGAIVARASTQRIATGHRDVERALRFIHEHLDAPLSVQTVVADNALSRSGLKQAFQRHRGRSIQAEIERARLERIHQRLLTTDWSLEDIAADVGLSGARSLHRLFARHGDETPTEFRRRYRP
jgi:LacI family transcriptional regulator